MNAKQNYSFAELTDKIASNIKIQSGNKITLSAHHKCDSQAIILIDDDCVLTEDDDRKEITYDEYLIELCFKDVSKALIKTIVIDEKQCLCVQEPSENGLHRSDGSDTPIPLGFSSVVTTNHSNPKWIDKNEFKLQFKIYSSNNCRFSLFVNNENEFCLMFGAKIYSVCDICSEVSYKCWLKNEEGKLKICDYSTQLVDIYQEEYNNAE
jgi:hypothetical protein